MKIETIYSKVEKQLLAQLPFVIYKKPGEKSVQAFFQKNNFLFTTTQFNISGFVFSPFDRKQSAVLFPMNDCELCVADIKESVTGNTGEKEFEGYSDLKPKSGHIQIIKLGIDRIKNTNLQKVVLSRREVIPVADTPPLGLFKKMINTYKTAFTYLWYHPKIGIWLGATPETLLQIKGSSFFTMALAGTQPYAGSLDVQWGDKEVEEQRLVTEFIMDALREKVTKISKSDPYTHKAGSLLHLRTDIKASVDSISSDITGVIRALHPTPAVCGLPRDIARSFISDHEGYDRGYYTGFLGELNMGFKDANANFSHIFVNLRSMQLKEKEAIIYVGGGITKDSDPEKEWEETVRKTMTMKKVLF